VPFKGTRTQFDSLSPLTPKIHNNVRLEKALLLRLFELGVERLDPGDFAASEGLPNRTTNKAKGDAHANLHHDVNLVRKRVSRIVRWAI
jgi:hypothetical protein